MAVKLKALKRVFQAKEISHLYELQGLSWSLTIGCKGMKLPVTAQCSILYT